MCRQKSLLNSNTEDQEKAQERKQMEKRRIEEKTKMENQNMNIITILSVLYQCS